jgi:hypothetical protein
MLKPAKRISAPPIIIKMISLSLFCAIKVK